jgi:hypothetical protein
MYFNSVSKVFLVLILSIVSGCNAYTTQKRTNSFDTTITSYNIALRWAQYETLYSYYVSPNGTQPPADMERLQEVSVTGIQQVQKTINAEENEANVIIIVKYYLKYEGSVKTLKLDQNWWFNEPNKQWFIDGPFPKF